MTPKFRARSMLVITLWRLARSYSALWGLCMVCALIATAAFADFIKRYPRNKSSRPVS